jgi:leader peptidase (prepilin peptidase)/N-methyltransferase
MPAEFFELIPAAFYVVVGVFGLLVGSFLNVVIHRLPIMMDREWRRQCRELAADIATTAASTTAEKAAPDRASAVSEQRAHDAEVPAADPVYNLWQPRSACPGCQTQIAAYDNIPVLSYVLLGGRCRHCGASISARYPLIETAAAAMGLVVAWVFGPTWQTVAALGVSWTLLALSVIDIDRYLLPDSMTLPLMWAGIVVSLVEFDGVPLFVDARSSVIGAVAGYLILWSVYQLFKLVTGKEGMGYGDFKLLAALGAWLGWQQLPLVILLSAATGAVVGSLLLLAGGKSRQTPIPFGPYLAAAGWIGLLWGPQLTALYLTSVG